MPYGVGMNENPTPYRQVRADYDDRHITVYQAYSPQIAEPAVVAGHFDPALHANHDAWAAGLHSHPVRIQWDPERGLHHQPLDHRSIQIGLGGRAAVRWHDSIAGLSDVTDLVRRVHTHVATGDLGRARELLPVERPYPVPEDLVATLGMVRSARRRRGLEQKLNPTNRLVVRPRGWSN